MSHISKISNIPRAESPKLNNVDSMVMFYNNTVNVQNGDPATENTGGSASVPKPNTAEGSMGMYGSKRSSSSSSSSSDSDGDEKPHPSGYRSMSAKAKGTALPPPLTFPQPNYRSDLPVVPRPVTPIRTSSRAVSAGTERQMPSAYNSIGGSEVPRRSLGYSTTETSDLFPGDSFNPTHVNPMISTQTTTATNVTTLMGTQTTSVDTNTSESQTAQPPAKSTSGMETQTEAKRSNSSGMQTDAQTTESNNDRDMLLAMINSLKEQIEELKWQLLAATREKERTDDTNILIILQTLFAAQKTMMEKEASLSDKQEQEPLGKVNEINDIPPTVDIDETPEIQEINKDYETKTKQCETELIQSCLENKDQISEDEINRILSKHELQVDALKRQQELAKRQQLEALQKKFIARIRKDGPIGNTDDDLGGENTHNSTTRETTVIASTQCEESSTVTVEQRTEISHSQVAPPPNEEQNSVTDDFDFDDDYEDDFESDDSEDPPSLAGEDEVPTDGSVPEGLTKDIMKHMDELSPEVLRGLMDLHRRQQARVQNTNDASKAKQGASLWEKLQARRKKAIELMNRSESIKQEYRDVKDVKNIGTYFGEEMIGSQTETKAIQANDEKLVQSIKSIQTTQDEQALKVMISQHLVSRNTMEIERLNYLDLMAVSLKDSSTSTSSHVEVTTQLANDETLKKDLKKLETEFYTDITSLGFYLDEEELRALLKKYEEDQRKMISRNAMQKIRSDEDLRRKLEERRLRRIQHVVDSVHSSDLGLEESQITTGEQENETKSTEVPLLPVETMNSGVSPEVAKMDESFYIELKRRKEEENLTEEMLQEMLAEHMRNVERMQRNTDAQRMRQHMSTQDRLAERRRLKKEQEQYKLDQKMARKRLVEEERKLQEMNRANLEEIANRLIYNCKENTKAVRALWAGEVSRTKGKVGELTTENVKKKRKKKKKDTGGENSRPETAPLSVL
ncbi:cingulin [Lingula anatina]|uniref:Cingulin n=1 Tax=Lingula anatina TaxID=7574 RepID=A0A1S3JNA1_LINAN|nr:cingulin [Lingula anatina]|eukprot:XP_013411853.1 cingulin [Lingula anatina]